MFRKPNEACSGRTSSALVNVLHEAIDRLLGKDHVLGFQRLLDLDRARTDRDGDVVAPGDTVVDFWRFAHCVIAFRVLVTRYRPTERDRTGDRMQGVAATEFPIQLTHMHSTSEVIDRRPL